MANQKKNNNKICKEIKKCANYIAITILTLIITISITVNDYIDTKNNNIALAQNQTQNQNQQQQQQQIQMKDNASKSDETRTLKVTFDSIKINKDHDPLFSGEWLLDAYVNNVWVQLWPGSKGVDDGQNIPLDTSVNVNVTNNSTGELRLATVGFENDAGYEELPIFPTLLDVDLPFIVYASLAQEITDDFTLFDVNDPIGVVVKQFTIAQNFGIGEHEICSEKSITPFSQGSCDYMLNISIDEVK